MTLEGKIVILKRMIEKRGSQIRELMAEVKTAKENCQTLAAALKSAGSRESELEVRVERLESRLREVHSLFVNREDDVLANVLEHYAEGHGDYYPECRACVDGAYR